MQTIRYTVQHRVALQQLSGYVPGLYAEIRGPLKIFQTAAFMEVERYTQFVGLPVKIFPFSDR